MFLEPNHEIRTDDKCLTGTLLDLEHSQGQVIGHLFSIAITVDYKFKLVRRNMLLPTLALPAVLATEAYQLPFESWGRMSFG